MKRSEVNRDPERARARAVSDLRCAVRKLGVPAALEAVADLLDGQGESLKVERIRRLAAELARDRGHDIGAAS